MSHAGRRHNTMGNNNNNNKSIMAISTSHWIKSRRNQTHKCDKTKSIHMLYLFNANKSNIKLIEKYNNVLFVCSSIICSPTTNWSFQPLHRQRSGQFQHHVLNSVPETAVLTTPPPLRKRKYFPLSTISWQVIFQFEYSAPFIDRSHDIISGFR